MMTNRAIRQIGFMVVGVVIMAVLAKASHGHVFSWDLQIGLLTGWMYGVHRDTLERLQALEERIQADDRLRD